MASRPTARSNGHGSGTNPSSARPASAPASDGPPRPVVAPPRPTSGRPPARHRIGPWRRPSTGRIGGPPSGQKASGWPSPRQDGHIDCTLSPRSPGKRTSRGKFRCPKAQNGSHPTRGPIPWPGPPHQGPGMGHFQPREPQRTIRCLNGGFLGESQVQKGNQAVFLRRASGAGRGLSSEPGPGPHHRSA